MVDYKFEKLYYPLTELSVDPLANSAEDERIDRIFRGKWITGGREGLPGLLIDFTAGEFSGIHSSLDDDDDVGDLLVCSRSMSLAGCNLSQ